MLLDGDASLLLVKVCGRLATAESDVQIRDRFVENAAAERWFNFSIPDKLWIEMQICTKPASNDYPACEFISKLCRYSKPTLVIKLSFEIIQCGGTFPSRALGLFFNGSGVCFVLPVGCPAVFH